MQIVSSILHHRSEFHLLGDIDATTFVKTRQRKQILHQHRHACTGRLDMRDGLVGTFQRPRHVTLHFVEFRVTMNRSKRGAQFMTGVGNEPLHLLSRFLLRVEAFLNARQHGVQRHGQRTDFRVLRQVGNALAQISCRDLRRCLFDAFQRSKRTLHDDGAEDDSDQHHCDADHGAEPRQRVCSVNLVAERQSDEHDATVFDFTGFAFLAPRQRYHTPWRLRGLHDGMIRHPTGGDMHHRLRGERLS